MSICRTFCFYLCIALCLFVTVCFAGEEDATTQPLLNVSCREADVRDVLRGIAMQYDVNIVPDRDVLGNVTIHLQNALFEAGLRTILETNGFEYEKRDGMYLVHVKDSAAKNLQMSIQDGKVMLDAESADVRQLLSELSKQAGLNIVAETGVTGNVTAHLSGVPVEEALYSLLTANEFMVDEADGIYNVRSGVLRQQRNMGSFAIFYRNNRLSIDVKNAPVVDVLSEIASQCKLNLTTVGNVQGSVTMRLDGVTLKQALDTLMDATGITYVVIDGIYRVGDPTVRPGQTNPLLERKVIWLKHIEAPDLISSLPGDIPKTNVTFSDDRNAIIVLGPRKIVQQVESLVEEIDLENPDIRSRQDVAISVEVDDKGLLTIDTKDSPMEMLLREISIRKGIDMTILGGAGVGIQSSFRSSGRRQRARQASQMPAESTSASPSPRVTTTGPSGTYGELVNFRIAEATLEETLNALFKGTAYTYKKETEGDREFYIIGTGELLPGVDNPLVVSKKIRLRYLNASSAADVVNSIMDVVPVTIPDENIVLIEDQNALVLIGTQKMVDEMERYIAQIDSPASQIMIEVLLIEITKGDSRDLGMGWSWSDEGKKNLIEIGPGLSAAFGSVGSVPENFFVVLNSLISENKARVLAKPRIATTNGLQATITVGWTEYFETTTEIYRGADVPVGGYTRRGYNTLESGITLDITPWVGTADEITVLIHPDIKDAKRISKEHSTIANRSLDTTVRVKDGQTIIIGGLIQRNESSEETRVPLLSSIPVLGKLFRESNETQSETELIMIVKPQVIGRYIAETGGKVTRMGSDDR